MPSAKDEARAKAGFRDMLRSIVRQDVRRGHDVSVLGIIRASAEYKRKSKIATSRGITPGSKRWHAMFPHKRVKSKRR